MGTILEATEESIIDRENTTSQQDSISSTPLAKRTRSFTTTAAKSPPAKRAKKKPQLLVENDTELQQVTLSQFTSMEPTVQAELCANIPPIASSIDTTSNSYAIASSLNRAGNHRSIRGSIAIYPRMVFIRGSARTRVTKRLEGRAEAGECGSIWEGLPALETLLSHVELMKTEYATHKPLATSLNEAWFKLRDYYEKMDESPAYAAALMLYPRHKLHYFHKRWKTHLAEFIQPTINTLRRLYEEEYGCRYPITSKISSMSTQKRIDPLQDFLDEELVEESDHDQFQAYNNLQPELLPLDESIFKWWARRESQYPALAH
ncbi:MAG: hypothetical protein M1829_000459 [Trizodia sp. TS-e1964]|nr:MAG: hypothetical protein M1829_000459 [Trizodia sp. TS-e1964]